MSEPNPRDIKALIRAGDELHYMLKQAHGIDVMRAATLREWTAAKERVQDPYGTHLKAAIKR